MKRILPVLLLCALLLAACQGDAGWKSIPKKGELVIGLDDRFAPMGFRDGVENSAGFNIDPANGSVKRKKLFLHPHKGLTVSI